MFSSTVLSFVAMLAAPASVVANECFLEGHGWRNADAFEILKTRCIDYYATGTWDAGEKTSDCFDLATSEDIFGPTRMDVEVNNDADESREMSEDICVELAEKATSCNKGGKYSSDDWFFRADPNKGWCE